MRKTPKTARSAPSAVESALNRQGPIERTKSWPGMRYANAILSEESVLRGLEDGWSNALLAE